MTQRLTSAVGIVLLIAIGWAAGNRKSRFPWRTVGWGLGLQAVIVCLLLRTAIGDWMLKASDFLSEAINRFTLPGLKLLFGPIGTPELMKRAFGEHDAFVFILSLAGAITLVSALSNLMFHWGVLQQVVKLLAFLMTRTMKTGAIESLAAGANIFLGQTEAPLIVKPYLSTASNGQLLAIMIGGMASLSASMVAIYSLMGISSGHLIAASFMSAPASLLFAAILLPQTIDPLEQRMRIALVRPDFTNSFDALCKGAYEGIHLVITILAMVIAFSAVVELFNQLLFALEAGIGLASRPTLQTLFGFVNVPFAFALGVDPKDCRQVGYLLGERIVLNEFFAYKSLAPLKGQITDRSFTIATYALSGFANFSSIAIQIGGIGRLVPDRMQDIAKLGSLAMIGGLLSCYLTGAIVGVLW